MYGWMSGWMGGWMDGWMDEQIICQVIQNSHFKLTLSHVHVNYIISNVKCIMFLCLRVLKYMNIPLVEYKKLRERRSA